MLAEIYDNKCLSCGSTVRTICENENHNVVECNYCGNQYVKAK